MREIRKDPIHNRWVIIASDRKERPHAFYTEDEDVGSKRECPFCEGKEKRTPPEVDSIRDSGKADEPGWKVRVVPNKFPALISEIESNKIFNGLSYKIGGFGIHEVIIETPHHKKNLFNMDEKEISLIISMYRKRYLSLKENNDLKYILIFKNYGKIAGASLPHSHSQVIGLPLIPPEIEEELSETEESVECPYCNLIQRAYEEERVLSRNKDFIAFAPFASIAPYELVIFPLEHKPCFEEIKDSEIKSLSESFKEIFKKYKKVLNEPPFNYFLHTAPIEITHRVYKKYHWHILIMPKLSMTAGFEMGSNIYINPVAPKNAIKELREGSILE